MAGEARGHMSSNCARAAPRAAPRLLLSTALCKRTCHVDDLLLDAVSTIANMSGISFRSTLDKGSCSAAIGCLNPKHLPASTKLHTECEVFRPVIKCCLEPSYQEKMCDEIQKCLPQNTTAVFQASVLRAKARKLVTAYQTEPVLSSQSVPQPQPPTPQRKTKRQKKRKAEKVQPTSTSNACQHSSLKIGDAKQHLSSALKPKTSGWAEWEKPLEIVLNNAFQIFTLF